MTYYFSNGNEIIGVSLETGLITSSVTKTYPDGGFTLDMMRSSQNCFGASKIRINNTTGIEEIPYSKLDGILFPNPAVNQIALKNDVLFSNIEIYNSEGRLMLQAEQKVFDIARWQNGIYIVKINTENGGFITTKFVKHQR